MAKKNKEPDIPKAQAGELGNLLRQYRDSIGYTTAETADALCLSEIKIIKLEEEDFATLAEPPYIRGYLRNYAKLAEKDPTQLISLYESLRGASPDELEHHFKPLNSINRKPSMLPMLLKLLMLLLILGGLITLFMQPKVTAWFSNTWNSFSQQTDKQLNNHNGDNNPLLTGSMPDPLPIPLEQKNTTTNGAINNPSQVVDNNTNVAKINARLADLDKTDKSDTPDKIINNTTDNNVKTDTTPATPIAEAETSSTHAKIKLVFKKEVWLRIKDKNNKTVYEGQTAAGKEKELELEKPLTFRIGNAQGISIFIDGKAKDITKHIKGSVANFTIE